MIIFSRLIDKHIAEYQNDLIEKHCEEVENMYRQMRGVKHDLKHHIQTMKAPVSYTHLDVYKRQGCTKQRANLENWIIRQP